MTSVTVGKANRGLQPKLGSVLTGIARCPHCSVAIPNFEQLWLGVSAIPNTSSGRFWATYRCMTCGGVILAKASLDQSGKDATLNELFPATKNAHEDIPEPARKFLQQAIETRHAPDAAAVMAGSAVDAMLKELGYEDGSVYERIRTAVADHKLTEGMGAWAHEVRLGSNRPRHADRENPHVSPKEAAQSVEFAEALGYFLFVLTKRIERGTEEAKRASEPDEGGQPPSRPYAPEP